MSASSSREREIYDLHVSTFGLEPSATLFIDDSAANVDGRQASGLAGRAVHRMRKTLEADLERLGITP